MFLILLVIFYSINAQDWVLWPNEPPDSIPFEKSPNIIGWEYLNDSYSKYQGADTWYPFWSSDGNQYSSFTDGIVYLSNGTSISSSSDHKNVYYGNSTTGFITIIGNNTSNLSFTNAGTFTSDTYPYTGRYPSTTFVFNNTWFYGTHGINAVNNDSGIIHIQCPFIGFRWSFDYGNTWIEPRIKMKYDGDNLFKETCNNSNIPIKFGSPHIVDFGENNEYSPDGKIYLIAHGASTPNSIVSWIQGDDVYLVRVYPNIQSINDSNSYEFYGGKDNETNKDLWIKGNVFMAKPLFSWNNHTGDVTMTYFNILKKYIITITTPTFSPNTTGPFDSYFLESDNITGPFKYITYLSHFGPQAYFLNYPTKFLSKSITNSYYNGYLSYSANWDYPTNQTKPIGGGYHWTLQKIRLKIAE